MSARFGMVTELKFQGTRRTYRFTVDYPDSGGIKAHGPYGLWAVGSCFRTLVRNVGVCVQMFEDGLLPSKGRDMGRHH